MIHYARIIAACRNVPWAIQPEKLKEISAFLRLKAKGGFVHAPEIEAILADNAEIRAARGVRNQPGNVAVIPVYGVISQRIDALDSISGDGGSSTERVARQFRAALNDDNVKAIVFDVDSPGGNVYGVAELADEVFEARGKKPIVAQVNSLAASAAYWIASAAEEIAMTPSGEVGSIGVYALHEDVSKWLEMEGVKETFISAGKYKVEGNPFEPLSDEARAAIQARVDDYYRMFVKAVSRGRNVSDKEVRDGFGEGRVVGATDAKKLGMVDRVATFAETMERFGASRNPTPAKAATPEAPAPKTESDPPPIAAADAQPSLAALAREIDLITLGS